MSAKLGTATDLGPQSDQLSDPADEIGGCPTGRIPVSVLTGFLGSGKTTLLAHLLRHPDFARTAVIINEAGEVGLDHDLVEASEESFIELQTGCLCCTVRGDLVRTLDEMLRRRDAGTLPPFTRVVIETSGLADPAPAMQAIMTDQGIAARLALTGVVTCVDAVNGLATLAAQPESVKQAAVADRLVLTKTDLSGGIDAALAQHLAALNPSAPRLIADHGRIDPAQLFDLTVYDARGKITDVARWLASEAQPSRQSPPSPAGRGRGWGEAAGATIPEHVASPHPSPLPAGEGSLGRSGAPSSQAESHRHSDILCHTIVREQPVPAIALTLFLEVVAEHFGADLLRLKGIVNIAESPDRPAVIHGVQHVFHPPAWLDRWPSADRRTRLVLITRGIPRDVFTTLIDALAAEVQAVSTTTTTQPTGNSR